MRLCRRFTGKWLGRDERRGIRRGRSFHSRIEGGCRVDCAVRLERLYGRTSLTPIIAGLVLK